MSSLGRTSSTSASEARASATAPTRRATSAIAICATAPTLDTLRYRSETIERSFNVAGRPRRLSRSALLRRHYNQVREAEGVVRVESDSALLQPGHRDACTPSPSPGVLLSPDAIQSGCRTRRPRSPRRSTQAHAVRSAAEAQHRRLQADLQRDAAPRSECCAQEHDERRQAAVGGHVRLQQRGRAGGAGRHAHDRARRRRRVDQSAGVGAASDTTARSSATTSTRSSGTTRCASPIRRRPGRSRAAMALWPNSNMNTGSVTRLVEAADCAAARRRTSRSAAGRRTIR